MYQITSIKFHKNGERQRFSMEGLFLFSSYCILFYITVDYFILLICFHLMPIYLNNSYVDVGARVHVFDAGKGLGFWQLPSRMCDWIVCHPGYCCFWWLSIEIPSSQRRDSSIVFKAFISCSKSAIKQISPPAFPWVCQDMENQWHSLNDPINDSTSREETRSAALSVLLRRPAAASCIWCTRFNPVIEIFCRSILGSTYVYWIVPQSPRPKPPGSSF